MSRLYASTWYALGDTRPPLRYASIRVALTLALGVVASLWLPHALGIDAKWGVAGLTTSAGVAAWFEVTLLRRSVALRIGHTVVDRRYIAELWLGAAVALAPPLLLARVVTDWHPLVSGAVVLVAYGAAYLGIALARRVPEAQQLVSRVSRLWGQG